MIRHNEIQYLVWDSYSAARSQFFATHLLRYVDRYNGRPIHTELVRVRSKDGEMSAVPVIVIFAVRSSNAVTR
jgi:hypothetical protein